MPHVSATAQYIISRILTVLYMRGQQCLCCLRFALCQVALMQGASSTLNCCCTFQRTPMQVPRVLLTVLLVQGGSTLANNYGALAYDRGSGAWGASYNQTSQPSADAIALRQGGRFSSRCTLVVRFWNMCAAYATGDGTSYGWGVEQTRRAAAQRAIRECRARGSQCELRMWACNSEPMSGSTSSGPEARPRYSCWYPSGRRVPDCTAGTDRAQKAPAGANMLATSCGRSSALTGL
jgi:hypothetical protein